MSRENYTRIHSKYLPQGIISLYQIDGLIAEGGYVYINITKGMHGLKQVSIIAYEQLIFHIEPHGYYPVPFTTGLWDHQKRIKNGLCVDDFGKIFQQR